MLKTLITDAFSSSANNKLWELMMFILKLFSHSNFDGTHWLGAVCRADKANSVAKSLAALLGYFRKTSFAFKRRMGLISITAADLGHVGLLFCRTILVPCSEEPLVLYHV